MALRKQNRTIWFLATAIILLVMAYLFREGKFEKFFQDSETTPASAGANPNLEEQFGDKVEAVTPEEVDNSKKFISSLDKLAECLNVKSAEFPESVPVQIETVLDKFKSELGTVSHQADRWMSWQIRTADGKEKMLRLEITENDEGKIGRELHYFNLTPDHQNQPIEMDPDVTNNPSDETINLLLKEGEVFDKERAATAFFLNNDRIDFIERDGELSELDLYRGADEFHCSDVKVPETCLCEPNVQ